MPGLPRGTGKPSSFNKRFVACDRRLTLLTAEQNMNMLLKQRGGETNG
jgi:hypothetical protein